MTITVGVFSGKGGTGKTSLVASLVSLSDRCIAVDADVDAANLALLLPGERLEERVFSSGEKAVLDEEICIACGACVPACPFDALVGEEIPEVKNWACEGCRICVDVCPVDALSMVRVSKGRIWVRKIEQGHLVHAHLGIAQDNSGSLVSKVREIAQDIVKRERYDLVLVDGPPGVGCPVHAAMTGLDRVVGVAEPGVSSQHDLTRFLDLAVHFGIPAAVVINKWDLAPDKTLEIEAMCEARGVLVLGRVPFDPMVPQALANADLPLSVPSVGRAIETIWRALQGWITTP